MILKYDEYELLTEEAISDFYDLAGDILWFKNKVVRPVKKIMGDIITKPMQIYLNRKLRNMTDDDKLMYMAKITGMIIKFKESKTVDNVAWGALMASLGLNLLNYYGVTNIGKDLSYVFIALYSFWILKTTVSGLFQKKAEEYYDKIRDKYVDFNYEDEELDEWSDVKDDDILDVADAIKKNDFYGNVKIYYNDDGGKHWYKYKYGNPGNDFYYIKDKLERKLTNPLLVDKYIKIGEWEIIPNGKDKWILSLKNVILDKSHYKSLLKNDKGIKNFFKTHYMDEKFVEKVEIEKINESQILKFDEYKKM